VNRNLLIPILNRQHKKEGKEEMKVRLLARDSKQPNIAIMKISTYHKNRGDDVNWYNPLLDQDCDLLYESILFDFTPSYFYYPKCKVVKGGTGYDISLKLCDEIEKINILDYSLYPDCDYSMQFYSRGCNNKCSFCVVPKKEGKIRAVEPMTLNPKGKWIEILDNSFFDNPNWRNAVKDIGNKSVNLLGVRLQTLNEEKVETLNKLKFAKNKKIHIAWDFPKENLKPKLEWLISKISKNKIVCYVLVGYNSSMEEDLYRLRILKELGITPFVMAYNKFDSYQKDITRWANVRAIFNKIDFTDYKPRSEYGGYQKEKEISYYGIND